jgi:hypothetical protein
MKRSIEIPFQALMWLIYAVMLLVESKLYLEVAPNAPFGQQLGFVISLDVFYSAIFFYVTYFCLPWALKSIGNKTILGVILFVLLTLFAIPALNIGIWQVLSSVVPHFTFILLAIGFRKLFV